MEKVKSASKSTVTPLHTTSTSLNRRINTGNTFNWLLPMK